MFEKIKLWYISCSTGCSCCSNENFDEGFYKSEEEANRIANNYRNGIGNPLSSQYSKYGRYYIHDCEAELLPDGRIIVNNDRVFEKAEYIGKLDI